LSFLSAVLDLVMSSYEDAVFAACKYGRMEDIEDLLKDANAKWNIKDELGNSPLHYAAGAGHHEIVSKLVASGKVEVNAQNGRGDTALHKTAVKHSDGHIQVAAILVEEGKIDISLKNVEGKTAADLALSADMKAICEPYVAIPGYDPEADADAEAAEEDSEDDEDDDE
jgi:ankyrin repeat protein